ncbi:unnamed protein product [Chrysodeixis includens]|uniref:Scavenger receptor class B member 1 n=1 Tax=Chrysodeixis includens TaxID=689277 RepID=A0A9N8Q360_CHRIL|nr:unnamed protein product [Chrysodeixis includens]
METKLFCLLENLQMFDPNPFDHHPFKNICNDADGPVGLVELKLWNGSLSYSYWHKPGVIRLTKVYIFNVTNPQGFLEHGEKPKLVEVGPFVYREDMEKVNIKFHENDTVTYQHNKILRFVPEMSVDKSQKLIVPNIPLLTVTSFSPNLASWLFNMLVSGLSIAYRDRAKPFVDVTAEELVFGYDDPLVTLAHYFYPKGKRPNSQMGLLLAILIMEEPISATAASVTVTPASYAGHIIVHKRVQVHFLPLTLIARHRIVVSDCRPRPRPGDGDTTGERSDVEPSASEGSFFPPRSVTKADIIHIYDKDLCRILPMQYREDVYKDGIKAGLYTPPSSTFESADINPDNKCYYPGEKCPPRGLQNISPCQYNAPVYLSFPHFYDADPALLEPFDGLKPNKKKHETYFMIQPKIGVPVEGFVRVQLNMKVDRASNIPINNINKFPDMIFPVMWLEEGIHELSTPIWRWIFLATTVAPIIAPILTYSLILAGLLALTIVFIKTYKSLVIGQNSIEIVELGRQTLRRGSTLIITGSNKILQHRESYTPLNQNDEKAQELDVRSECAELKNVLKSEFVRPSFSDAERESLIRSDNTFILSEHRFD